MHSLLDNVTKADIVVDPYPYLLVRNVLPREFADYLLEHFPSIEEMSKGASGAKGLSVSNYPENKKFCMYGKEVVDSDSIDLQIREFFAEHASVEFFKKITALFEEHIKVDSPKAYEYIQSINEDGVGFIHESGSESKKLIIDGGLCIDTPAKTPDLNPGVHLDNPKKICGALLYLKHPEDRAPGGEFNVYGTPKAKVEIDPKMMVKSEYMPLFKQSLAKSIGYEHNTLLVFLNSSRAFHGVVPRYYAEHFRYTMNLAFNANRPVHNFSKYEESFISKKLRAGKFYFKKITGR
ncbi:hypothetical protein KW785_00530 [Candidatus Parcubacteria bacterium]|nr:hypothetical protein [Candidatus Parcubacteria bacterium]